MTVLHRKQASSVLEPGVKYTCDVCAADITRCVRVHCAVCVEYDVCVLCFCRGQATSGHRADHAYYIVEQHSQPIFEGDWGADEELLLIEGCETHGLGNWADVAVHVGTRTRRECEEHYLRIYVHSATYPDPPMDLVFDVEPGALALRKTARLAEQRNGCTNGGNGSSQLLIGAQKPVASVPQNHEVAGYMPGRLEFDVEHENDAEASIKDLAFDEDDVEEETRLKLAVLDVYNSRLVRRCERRRVIFEHRLIEMRRLQAADKRRSKDEREAVARTRPFARVLGRRDYELFVEGLLREHALRRRIAELQEWRRNGLVRTEQGQRYEADKARRLSILRAPVNVVARTPTRRDAQLLSFTEKRLCLELGMVPAAYLAVKETLLRVSFGGGRADSLSIDPRKRSRIAELLRDTL